MQVMSQRTSTVRVISSDGFRGCEPTGKREVLRSDPLNTIIETTLKVCFYSAIYYSEHT